LLVSSVCTRGMSYRGRARGLLTCYPNTTLAMARELMEAKGIKQLPVVKRSRDHNRERKRRIVGLLHYDDLWHCLRFFFKSDTYLIVIIITIIIVIINIHTSCISI
jgi:CBS-domain-containing membrane protein